MTKRINWIEDPIATRYKVAVAWKLGVNPDAISRVGISVDDGGHFTGMVAEFQIATGRRVEEFVHEQLQLRAANAEACMPD